MKRLVWLLVLAAVAVGGVHGLQYLQRHRADRLSRVREMARFGWLPKWGLSEQAFLASEHARCFAPAFHIEAFSSRYDRAAYERCLDQAAERQLGRLARLEQPYWSRQDENWLRLDYTLRLTEAKLPESGMLQRERFECAGEFVSGGDSPVAGSSFDEVAPGELHRPRARGRPVRRAANRLLPRAVAGGRGQRAQHEPARHVTRRGAGQPAPAVPAAGRGNPPADARRATCAGANAQAGPAGAPPVGGCGRKATSGGPAAAHQ